MKAEEVLGRIKELREAKEWSLYRLAKESKVPYSSLYNLEKRKSYPQIDTLEMICDGLQISLSDFFLYKEKKEEHITEEDYELIDLNHMLSRKNRDRVLVYAQALVDSEGKGTL